MYQLILPTAWVTLGLRCSESEVFGLDFLAQKHLPLAPQNALAETAASQLLAYFNNPSFQFNLPLATQGTPHQRKVWQCINEIPSGQIRCYGDIAKQIGSAAQAVGQACGANPWPIIVPCHRVLAKSGLGGFANQRDGHLLTVKQALLQHESLPQTA